MFMDETEFHHVFGVILLALVAVQFFGGSTTNDPKGPEDEPQP